MQGKDGANTLFFGKAIGLSVQAFASLRTDGSQPITVLNFESTTPVILTVAAGQGMRTVALQCLVGPSLNATDGLSTAGHRQQLQSYPQHLLRQRWQLRGKPADR